MARAASGRFVLVAWTLLVAGLFMGCEQRVDPLAEHLLAQRQKAVEALEKRARRDLSLDILFWDVTDCSRDSRDVQRWIRNQSEVDVVALSGPELAALEVAASMEETINTLDRGWPVVTSTSRVHSNAGSIGPSNATGSGVSVINANGLRFDGVASDEVEGWSGAPAAPQPVVLQLQVRHTPLEAVLVYLDNAKQLEARHYAVLSRWIDRQEVPVLVFGNFPPDALSAQSLESIEPGHVSVSKTIAQSWRPSVERLNYAGEDRAAQPLLLRTSMVLPQ